MSVRTAGVLLAGGSGSRVGAEVNKVLLPVKGVPLIVHSIRAMLAVESMHRIVLVVRPADREDVTAAIAPHLGERDLWLVDGGTQRHDSEWHALLALSSEIESGEIEVVAIHDGARPLADVSLWNRVIDAAARHGGALPALTLPGLVGPDGVEHDVVGVHTPQAFSAPALLSAYAQAHSAGFKGTDTAACLERYSGIDIVGVPGDPRNLKVTFAEDIEVSEHLLS